MLKRFSNFVPRSVREILVLGMALYLCVAPPPEGIKGFEATQVEFSKRSNITGMSATYKFSSAGYDVPAKSHNTFQYRCAIWGSIFELDFPSCNELLDKLNAAEKIEIWISRRGWIREVTLDEVVILDMKASAEQWRFERFPRVIALVVLVFGYFLALRILSVRKKKM